MTRKPKNPHAVALGRQGAEKGGSKGGKARWEGLSKQERSEIARKAVRSLGEGKEARQLERRAPILSKPPPASSRYWKLINLVARVNVAVYRLSGGRLGGRFGRAPILLVHHVGRRSGKARVTPLLYLADGDRLVIVASKGGTDRHPAWFHNLMANPGTTVEVGRERRRVRARQASETERERLWPKLVEMYPPYATYQSHTDRRIPVVMLERV